MVTSSEDVIPAGQRVGSFTNISSPSCWMWLLPMLSSSWSTTAPLVPSQTWRASACSWPRNWWENIVVAADVVAEGLSFTHFPIVTSPSQWRMRTTHQSARGVAVHFMLLPISVPHRHGTAGNVMCGHVTTVILPMTVSWSGTHVTTFNSTLFPLHSVLYLPLYCSLLYSVFYILTYSVHMHTHKNQNKKNM